LFQGHRRGKICVIKLYFMTRRKSFTLALTTAYILFSLAAGANDHMNSKNENNPAGKTTQTEKQADQSSSGKHVPVSDGHSIAAW
jgi:hypothetical protein